MLSHTKTLMHAHKHTHTHTHTHTRIYIYIIHTTQTPKNTTYLCLGRFVCESKRLFGLLVVGEGRILVSLEIQVNFAEKNDVLR